MLIQLIIYKKMLRLNLIQYVLKCYLLNALTLVLDKSG